MGVRGSEHIGERSRLDDGGVIALYEYRGPDDIDIIRKDDDVIQRHCRYVDFKHFKIKRINSPRDSGIGEGDETISYDSRGNVIRLIKKYGAGGDAKVVIQYENGMIVDGTFTYDEFLTGKVHIEDRKSEEDILLFKKEKQNASIAVERNRTLLDCTRKLSQYRRCFVHRPPSFGKTHMAAQLFELPRYRKCLYISPGKEDGDGGALHIKQLVEKDKALGPGKKKMGNVEFITYRKLIRLPDDKLANMDYDLVYLDEAHCIGGDPETGEGAVQTFTAVRKLMRHHPETHFIGATATPARLDGIDVRSELFYGIEAYPYSLFDGLKDGIINKPVYKRYDSNAYIKTVNSVGKVMKKQGFSLPLDQMKKKIADYKDIVQLIEELETTEMPRKIRKVCDYYLSDTSYMKFIVFFPTISDLRDNKLEVVQHFKQAYPDHEVRYTEIHSEARTTLRQIHAEMPRTEMCIDLIFNVEMLTMGYHDDRSNGREKDSYGELTGIYLAKRTQSEARYTQIIGRILQCGGSDPKIIFDLLDNYSVKYPVRQRVLPEEDLLLGRTDTAKEKGGNKKPKAMTFREVEALYGKGKTDWTEWEKRDKETKEHLNRSGKPTGNTKPKESGNSKPRNTNPPTIVCVPPTEEPQGEPSADKEMEGIPEPKDWDDTPADIKDLFERAELESQRAKASGKDPDKAFGEYLGRNLYHKNGNGTEPPSSEVKKFLGSGDTEEGSQKPPVEEPQEDGPALAGDGSVPIAKSNIGNIRIAQGEYLGDIAVNQHDVDPMDVIQRLETALIRDFAKQAIIKYLKIPGMKWLKAGEERPDANTGEYLFLKACAETVGMHPETLLTFMERFGAMEQELTEQAEAAQG